ncbi:MAG: DUF3311 domain-containing protein [Candidatus Bathyarchaeia archaeon]
MGSKGMSKEKKAVIIAAIPPIILILGAPFVNRIEPWVLGMPFFFFWHFVWLIIGPLFLTAAYLVRTRGG